jgi:hypothetical protein
VQEYRDKPKYAILHLAASVELVLKARLMAEHWSLIIAPGDVISFDRLASGNSRSVTSQEAIRRLEGVLPRDQVVDKGATREFGALDKERNKIAHFFNESVGRPATDRREVLSRQCRVWFHLHELLAHRWKETFLAFRAKLAELDKTMREEHKFLRVVFDQCKQLLNTKEQRGCPILKCPACEFRAFVLPAGEGFGLAVCLVCLYRQPSLRVGCPGCKQVVSIECGDDQCPNCAHRFNAREVAELTGGEPPDKETDRELQREVYCGECGFDTVYQYDDRMRCTCCFEEWWEYWECEYCGQLVTGDPEDSYVTGCGQCCGVVGSMENG